MAGSPKDRLLANGDALQRRRVDVDAQTGTAAAPAPAAPAEGDVARSQRFAHQVPVVGTFQKAKAADAGRRNAGPPPTATPSRRPGSRADSRGHAAVANCASRSDGMKPPHFDSRMLNRSHVSSATARSASIWLHSDSSSMIGVRTCRRGLRPSLATRRARTGCSTELMPNGSSSRIRSAAFVGRPGLIGIDAQIDSMRRSQRRMVRSRYTSS